MLSKEKKSILHPAWLFLWQLSLAEMMGVYIEANLYRVIIMWGLGRKENYMEWVASLLCSCADRLQTLKVVELESKELLIPPKKWFPSPMLVLSQIQLLLK